MTSTGPSQRTRELAGRLWTALYIRGRIPGSQMDALVIGCAVAVEKLGALYAEAAALNWREGDAPPATSESAPQLFHVLAAIERATWELQEWAGRLYLPAADAMLLLDVDGLPESARKTIGAALTHNTD